jgi:hypothetical protein
MQRDLIGNKLGETWGRAATLAATFMALACSDVPKDSANEGSTAGQAGKSSDAPTVLPPKGGNTSVSGGSPGSGGTGGGTAGTGGTGGTLDAKTCEGFDSEAACLAAGCYPLKAEIRTRHGGGGEGGEGGARPQSCSVEEDAFLLCRLTGGGGAVNFDGCDATCNTCATWTNFLPKGWSTRPESCDVWHCEDGVVVE